MLTRYKHYDAVIDFQIDFVNRLQSGETLASGQDVSCTGVGSEDTDAATTDLTVGAASISGTKIQSRISGGKCLRKVDDERWESEYILRGKVVTSSGETESEVVRLVVYDGIEQTS